MSYVMMTYVMTSYVMTSYFMTSYVMMSYVMTLYVMNSSVVMVYDIIFHDLIIIPPCRSESSNYDFGRLDNEESVTKTCDKETHRQWWLKSCSSTKVHFLELLRFCLVPVLELSRTSWSLPKIGWPPPTEYSDYPQKEVTCIQMLTFILTPPGCLINILLRN